LRGKNKSFVEDTIILFIIGIIIYAIYSYFFASKEEISIQNDTNVIERNITSDASLNKESMNDEKEAVSSEKINEDINQMQKEEAIKREDTKNDVIETPVENKIEAIKKESKEAVLSNISEMTDIDLFYKNIEEKIYANIEKNVDKTSIKNKEFVNIRVTILKDGRYEQLTFMDGSKENFELYRSSITQVFPLKMNDTLRENFPRYFRMKIEIN
jgi:hypothetical protein